MSRPFRVYLGPLLGLCLVLAGCSQGKTEKKEVVAKINGYELTLEELERELAAELELDEGYKLTREGKKAFLERLIQKELLVQEAKQAKLDTRPDFVRTIERYWEATLIRDLMDLKAQETASKAYASEEEITERYDKMKLADAGLPALEECRAGIAAEIKEERKRERLGEWLRGMRKKARVEINHDLLQRK